MSEIERKTENEVSDLKKNLKEMPSNMKMFSLSMRSLYAEKAVGTDTETAIKFRKLRDDTRQDAIVYLKCILPATTKFVSSIKEYFGYYEALSYEEWREMLPDILEETTTYKEFAKTVLEMHEDILVPLKRREDEAKIIMTEFKDLQEEFEKQKAEFENSAKTKRGWAFALTFVPGVNAIATPLLGLAANLDSAKAIAKDAESKIHEAAALVVAHTLIPALSNFIDGLAKAAGFFSVMEQELGAFEGKAEKATKSPKQLYYKVMSKEAGNMVSLCQAFYAILPDIRTDFEAIPSEGTNQSYVDKWLEKKKAEIEKKRKSKISKFFLELFSKEVDEEAD